MSTTAKNALKAIEDLDKFGINLGLVRVEACLEYLGNPQKKYPTIHVGGTNGKGSTSAFTANILRCAGYKTGLYTSPPLQSFGERMRINGASMADERVPSLYDRVMEAASTVPACKGMTQFEIITAMGFLYFADESVDAAVIEVGLGGRLDSTNVIIPEVSAITNIGLEHSAHLGPTVEAIAREKAGIAKPGAPLVTTAVNPALGALRDEAARLGSPFYAFGEDFDLFEDGEGTHMYNGRNLRMEGIRIGLPGSFQRKNLSLSLAMIEILIEKGFKITAAHIRQGAETAVWPGRLELFGRVLIDGAHNPHAALALAESLKNGFPRKRLHLILGILDDKDAESIINTLAPLADSVILTRSSSRRALLPGELEKRAAGLVKGAEVSPDVASAIALAKSFSSPDDLIVVTGSLTLVGEARDYLESMESKA